MASDFGRHLIGRDIGAEIRRKHFSSAPDTWPTSLDFAGVEQATESCIDEVFGTLARDHGLSAVERIKFTGASSGVSETIEYVLSILRHPPKLPDARIIRNLLRGNGNTQKRRRARSKRPSRRDNRRVPSR